MKNLVVPFLVVASVSIVVGLYLVNRSDTTSTSAESARIEETETSTPKSQITREQTSSITTEKTPDPPDKQHWLRIDSAWSPRIRVTCYLVTFVIETDTKPEHIQVRGFDKEGGAGPVRTLQQTRAKPYAMTSRYFQYRTLNRSTAIIRIDKRLKDPSNKACRHYIATSKEDNLHTSIITLDD